jgi:hypothetical protein
MGFPQPKMLFKKAINIAKSSTKAIDLHLKKTNHAKHTSNVRSLAMT